MARSRTPRTTASPRWRREGHLSGLITQNVDGLHRRAGHRDLIELHGRVDRVHLPRLRRPDDPLSHPAPAQPAEPGLDEPRASQVAPDGDAILEATSDFQVATCELCGGRLKPDVVFFGENVRKDIVERCYQLTDEAQALVVLGSSLQVMSGLRFVRRARANCVPVVIVNRGERKDGKLKVVARPRVRGPPPAWQGHRPPDPGRSAADADRGRPRAGRRRRTDDERDRNYGDSRWGKPPNAAATGSAAASPVALRRGRAEEPCRGSAPAPTRRPRRRWRSPRRTGESR